MTQVLMRTGQERAVAAKKAAYERDKAMLLPQPEDPRIAKAGEQLLLMIGEYRSMDPRLNRQTARDMEQTIRDFRDTCKRKGIDMPRMKLVYFVRMNHVCIWPQDLEQAELQKRMRLFVIHRQRHNKFVDAEDMAIGVRRAYPDYSPSRTNLILPSDTKPTQENNHEA